MSNNREIIYGNLTRQLERITGNVGRYLGPDDRSLPRFLRVLQKMRVLVDRRYDLRFLGVSVGRLLTCYGITRHLGKSFRWATRRRITEYGSSPSRVQLEQQQSKVITLDDLHLAAPLRVTMNSLLIEVERDINNILEPVEEAA